VGLNAAASSRNANDDDTAAAVPNMFLGNIYRAALPDALEFNEVYQDAVVIAVLMA